MSNGGQENSLRDEQPTTWQGRLEQRLLLQEAERIVQAATGAATFCPVSIEPK